MTAKQAIAKRRQARIDERYAGRKRKDANARDARLRRQIVAERERKARKGQKK